MKKTIVTIVNAGVALLFSTLSHAIELPETDGHVHTGVVTCANSTCHGKTTAQEGEVVQLNEYTLWSREDFHSRAYQVLRNDESKAMARTLGLANAENADICLDCHADNIAPEYRGEKFQLTDGVGCEACHGGAENWLKSHTEPEATHADNLERGLYPLSDPIARAELCLSCHMGTKDKFANHAIMAAGHPRLTFELDTFTANQPAHYTVDDDYIERKAGHPVGYFWIVGQLKAAQRQLQLIDTHRLAGAEAMEFAIYDCHSCHQPMNPLRGRPDDFSSHLPAGGLRLLDHSFDMLAVIYQVVAKDQYATFTEAVRGLHSAHNQPQLLDQAIADLNQQLDALANNLRQSAPSLEQVKALRKQVAQTAAQGVYGDFTSAEQAFLALESLSFGLGDRNQIKGILDQLFDSLADETQFQPKEFARTSRRLVDAL